MHIIDGRKLSEEIYSSLRLKDLTTVGKLGIILASNDESSKKYVELKKAKGNDLGITTEIYQFDESSSKGDIISKIKELNNDSTFSGVMVQLPLFPHLDQDEYEILSNIDLNKDVDGLSFKSLGQSFIHNNTLVISATVNAILLSIKDVYPDLNSLKGLDISVVNNTNLIGLPLSIILSKYNATVHILNRDTKNLKDIVKLSDIVISASGETNLFSDEDVKSGSVLIDVTSVKKNGSVLGDFVYTDMLKNKVRAFTPVPGGVGPLTVASLFLNLVTLSESKSN